jgi:hypothetical protein
MNYPLPQNVVWGSPSQLVDSFQDEKRLGR